MKKLITLFIVFGLGTSLWAQQEEVYTLFMFNKINLNPAYAGAPGHPQLTALFKGQWVGLDGAPNAQLITFHMPIVNQRIGIGGGIFRNEIGPQESYTGELSYAYRLPLGRGYLGIGLQGSIRFLRVDFSEVEGTYDVSGDNAVPVGMQSRYIPNFGAGLYYDTERFYIGVSAPRILATSIDLADSDTEIAREEPHFYGMLGVLIPLGDKVTMEPQTMLRFTPKAPFDMDINVNFLFVDRFLAGVNYRFGGNKSTGLGESFSVLGGLDITRNVFFGLAYDIGLSDLRTHHSGSFEAIMRFMFGRSSTDDEQYLNPRFF